MIPDPHDPVPRREPFAKNVREEQFLQRLNECLREAELSGSDSTIDVTSLPLIYVVGAPRSGTTLLYQLICRHLPVAYINNLIARFWLRPSVGIRLSKALFGDGAKDTIALQSKHGVTDGAAGPHEFGYFWRHWLQLDRSRTHHLSAEELQRLDHAGLKRALEIEILASFARPVAFKNVICGFHALFLSRLHPASLFIHITRDAYATAASILNTRKDRYGSYSTWWSLKPSTYPFGALADNPAGEVVRQVVDCRREIEEELARPGVRAHRIEYESLCQDPEGVLLSICHRIQECGISVDLISQDIPELITSPASALPEDLERKLRQGLEGS